MKKLERAPRGRVRDAARGLIPLALLAASAGVAVLAAGPQASEAEAHFNFGKYSHSACPPTSATRKDPIKIMFFGNATQSRVDYHVRTEGWNGGIGSGKQKFYSHGSCLDNNIDRTNQEFPTNNRWHVRARPTAHSGPPWGTTTQATPHRDTHTAACGHIVAPSGQTPGGNGFDAGRITLVTRLLNTWHHSHHSNGAIGYGNGAPIMQCNGAYTSSSGLVSFLYIPPTP